MLFHKRVELAKKSGKIKTCTCWDCLRAVGLTPPFQIRSRYPRLYPHVAFNHNEGGEGDPGGVPRRPNITSEHKKVVRSERHNLRKAIQNREVR